MNAYNWNQVIEDMAYANLDPEYDVEARYERAEAIRDELREDGILVVDKQSGCHFIDTQLIHTDSCKCDEDYDRATN